jgi:hypothetical protein
MFGSQAIEVAIGLVLAFFLLATAASAVVEVISALYQKRPKTWKPLWTGCRASRGKRGVSSGILH